MNPKDFPPVKPAPGLEPWGVTPDFIARPRDEVGLQQAGRRGPGVVQVQDRHRGARLNGSQKYTVNTTSIQVLGEPTAVRNYLALSNVSSGTQIVYVEFGDDATLESPFRLTPGETLVMDAVVAQDRINAIASAAGARLTVAVSQYTP